MYINRCIYIYINRCIYIFYVICVCIIILFLFFISSLYTNPLFPLYLLYIFLLLSNIGNVHFITIDSETGFPDAPLEHKYVFPCGGFEEQIKWLENDLIKANANRQVTPWILVAGHRPMYQGSSVNVALQKAMEELFYKYGGMYTLEVY